MPHALVLQSPSAEALPSALLTRLPEPDYADEKRMRFIVEEGFSLSGADAALLDSRQIDHAVLPDMAFGELGLIVSDMDSTLITIECVDEIAAGVGLKDRVAEITERSMRGELDFEQSLRSRVALLAGLNERVLAEVYENVLQLSPGAEFLLDECKAHGVKFMLVSGGFTFFTERLQQRLGFEYQHANILEIENGKLTKTVRDPNYRGISRYFWNSLCAVGDESTFEVFGTPNCGKGEPNQVIRVGHASPVCAFSNVEVFGGGK